MPTSLILLALACLLSVFMLVAIDIFISNRGVTGWRRCTATLVLFFGQIVATEFILGVTSQLYSPLLALLNVLIAVSLLFLVYRTHGHKPFKRYLAGLIATPKSALRHSKSDLFFTALCVLGGLFLAWILFIGVLFPPLDWDGNAYHLAYVAQMLQNHSIFDDPSSLAWMMGYPKGGELLQGWTMLLTRDDTLADLSQVPFLLLGIVALYGIACNLGVRKNSARYAALLFLFTPAVLNQLPTAYVDIMLTASFFAALALITQKKYHKLDLLLIGICFSFLISIKASGVYMCAILMLPLLWNLYQEHGLRLKQYLTPALFVIVPLSVGLFWYIKNLVLYGSPLYPFGFNVAGHTIFKGWDYEKWSDAIFHISAQSQLTHWWYTWSEHSPDPLLFRYDYDSSYFGLGPIWFTILLPSIAFALYILIRKRLYRPLFVLVLLAGLLFIYPANFVPRYTMFVIVAGIICFGFLLDNLHRYTTLAIKTIVLALAVITLCVNFTLWTYRPGAVNDQIDAIRQGRGQHSIGTLYPTNFGNAAHFIRTTVEKNETVVYTDAYWVYPLWNGAYSNKVSFIDQPTKEAWYHEVKAKNADYVFIRKDPKINKNQWAKDKFKQVIYEDAGYEILKVN